MFDDEREGYLSGGFECNICLDLANDPVVTFCGHLYCWPCIFKWIHLRSIPSENPHQLNPQCPVCNAEVSRRTLSPLYGRGQATESSGRGSSGHQLHHRGNLQQPQTHQSNSTSYVAPPLFGVGGTTTNVC
ncbi:hypothetical protein HAX54_036471 [Datura stramonium]|uniref:E3 ubiquitin-protein ligase RMA n=1 Tax=Datura stramonium TaxID=4076 RepID=A0ABS8VIC4_DATST|nr:hypothetical protein [Datura stramonium]